MAMQPEPILILNHYSFEKVKRARQNQQPMTPSNL
jgi:hypothetical protein